MIFFASAILRARLLLPIFDRALCDESRFDIRRTSLNQKMPPLSHWKVIPVLILRRLVTYSSSLLTRKIKEMKNRQSSTQETNNLHPLCFSLRVFLVLKGTRNVTCLLPLNSNVLLYLGWHHENEACLLNGQSRKTYCLPYVKPNDARELVSASPRRGLWLYSDLCRACHQNNSHKRELVLPKNLRLILLQLVDTKTCVGKIQIFFFVETTRLDLLDTEVVTSESFLPVVPLDIYHVKTNRTQSPTTIQSDRRSRRTRTHGDDALSKDEEQKELQKGKRTKRNFANII